MLPAAAARRGVRRRGAGEVPGVQGGPARRRRLHGDGGRVRQVPRGRLLGATRSPREALTDECEILVVGAGFAGLLLWYKLQPGRLRRRPLLREGRRRRRHLVLEPLSGHRLRRRVLQLPPAARGDGLLPDDEVRVGLRDPRVLPEDGREVRLLRPLPVPHRRSSGPSGTRTTGRWTVYTDRGDAMRARFVILANGILTTPEAGPHRRAWRRSRASRSTPRAGTTTSTWRASGSASSAPAPPPCRPSPSWPRSSASCTCSSARRRRSTCATSGRRPTRRSTTWANEPGWARARRARFAKISAGPHGDPGQRRLPRRQGRRLQGAQAARAPS